MGDHSAETKPASVDWDDVVERVVRQWDDEVERSRQWHDEVERRRRAATVQLCEIEGFDSEDAKRETETGKNQAMKTFKITLSDGAWRLIEARDMRGALSASDWLYPGAAEPVKVKLMKKGKRQVRKHTYFDADTGKKRTAWDVIQKPFDSVNAAAGDYMIARYGDKATAEEHAHTGRPPAEYG